MSTAEELSKLSFNATMTASEIEKHGGVPNWKETRYEFPDGSCGRFNGSWGQNLPKFVTVSVEKVDIK